MVLLSADRKRKEHTRERANLEPSSNFRFHSFLDVAVQTPEDDIVSKQKGKKSTRQATHADLRRSWTRQYPIKKTKSIHRFLFMRILSTEKTEGGEYLSIPLPKSIRPLS